MAPNLEVPETDPRYGAGERICEHIDGVGKALTEDEKDGLGHIIAGHVAAGTLESLVGDFRTHHLVVAGLDRVDELQITEPPPQNFRQSVEYRHAAEALVRVLWWGRDYEASLMSRYERDAVQRMGVPPVTQGACGGASKDSNETRTSAALVEYCSVGENLRLGATRSASVSQVLKLEQGKDYSWTVLFLTILRSKKSGNFDGIKKLKKFVSSTYDAVNKYSKWMENDFFKENGFPEAIKNRIAELEAVQRSRDLIVLEARQLEALKDSAWLK